MTRHTFSSISGVSSHLCSRFLRLSQFAWSTPGSCHILRIGSSSYATAMRRKKELLKSAFVLNLSEIIWFVKLKHNSWQTKKWFCLKFFTADNCRCFSAHMSSYPVKAGVHQPRGFSKCLYHTHNCTLRFCWVQPHTDFLPWGNTLTALCLLTSPAINQAMCESTCDQRREVVNSHFSCKQHSSVTHWCSSSEPNILMTSSTVNLCQQQLQGPRHPDSFVGLTPAVGKPQS